MLVRDDLSGLGHRIDAIAFFHLRVDEPPSDGRVEDFGRALERGLRLTHDQRRAGHRFRAARNGEIDLARLDRARRRGDRVHARGAEAIDCHAGNRVRQSGQQQSHSRQVAVVLASLVGAAEDNLLDMVAKARVTAQELANGQRRQVVGARARKRAAIAADRRADIVADVGVNSHDLDSRIAQTSVMFSALTASGAFSRCLVLTA